MRFLLDMPVPPSLRTWLARRGHDAVHAVDLGLGSAPDRELLDRAAAEDRVIITADNDFPQMLALSHAGMPGVILFRRGDYRPQEMEDLLTRVLEQVSAATLYRAICVVDRQQLRCRPLPLR